VSALDTQVGGDHYKSMAIQPAEYIVRNNIGFLEGMVIKYVSRWEKKGGIEDLEKAIHCLQLRVEMAKQAEAIPVGEAEDESPEKFHQYFANHTSLKYQGTVIPRSTAMWSGLGE